jgi:hypothetical protein
MDDITAERIASAERCHRNESENPINGQRDKAKLNVSQRVQRLAIGYARAFAGIPCIAQLETGNSRVAAYVSISKLALPTGQLRFNETT